MRITDPIAVENFNQIAINIMENVAHYEAKIGKYLCYRDHYGRCYIVVLPLNLAIIVDECGNVQFYEEDTKSIIE